MNTEGSMQAEGKVIYDICFRVILPIGGHIEMIINVETQKAEHTIVRYRMHREDVHGYAKRNSRYDLMELVMVYLGREETAEKGTQLHGLLRTN